EVGQCGPVQTWPVTFCAGPDMLRGRSPDGTVLVEQDADQETLVVLAVARRARRDLRGGLRWRGGRRGRALSGLVAPAVHLCHGQGGALGQQLDDIVGGTRSEVSVGPDTGRVQ